MKSALAELFDLAARGELLVTIGGTYPLRSVSEAHRNLETRKTTGKVILTP